MDGRLHIKIASSMNMDLPDSVGIRERILRAINDRDASMGKVEACGHLIEEYQADPFLAQGYCSAMGSAIMYSQLDVIHLFMDHKDYNKGTIIYIGVIKRSRQTAI